MLRYKGAIVQTRVFVNVRLQEATLRLSLKAPITTAADDNHKYFFIVFQRK